MSTKSTEAQTTKPTILLVHGAYADSSSWNGVVDLLLTKGYEVRALPNTLRGLEADAAVISTYLKSRYLKNVSERVVLVGHSYGGSVIGVASANARNVKALVYVNAFVPKAGKSIEEDVAGKLNLPTDFEMKVPLPTGGDDLYVKREYFGQYFASAEPPDVAERLAQTQRPLASNCKTDKPAAVAQEDIPSWYVRGEADKIIPPKVQEKFARRANSKSFPRSGRGSSEHDRTSRGDGSCDRRSGKIALLPDCGLLERQGP